MPEVPSTPLVPEFPEVPSSPEVPELAAFSLYPTTPLLSITNVVVSEACSWIPSNVKDPDTLKLLTKVVSVALELIFLPMIYELS